VGLGDGEGAGDTVGDADGDLLGGENLAEGDDGRPEADGFGFGVGCTEDGARVGSTGKKVRARFPGNSEPIGRPFDRVGLAEAAADDDAGGRRTTGDGAPPRLAGDGSGACAK
jgi:hypothetical protein